MPITGIRTEKGFKDVSVAIIARIVPYFAPWFCFSVVLPLCILYCITIIDGLSGRTMVLGKFQCRPGCPTNLDIVGQGPTVLAVVAGEGCLDIVSHVYHFSLLSPTLRETVRHRLAYCLKGPLNQKKKNKKKKTASQLIVF